MLPQLSYACDSLYEHNTKDRDILKSALYQCLKWLMNIKGNVKRNILFEALEFTDRRSDTNDKENSIIPFLSIIVIKLRVNWLFSKYKDRLWNWDHKISSVEFINNWSKLDSWRENWNKEFKREQMTTDYVLLILKRFRKNQEGTHSKKIVKMINIATRIWSISISNITKSNKDLVINIMRFNNYIT